MDSIDTSINKLSEDEIFPIELKKMTTQETKDYHWNKLIEKFQKSRAEDSNNNNESITYEDWSKKLKEKYDNLKNVSDENLRGLWDSLEFELSVKSILNIKDCTLPFAW